MGRLVERCWKAGEPLNVSLYVTDSATGRQLTEAEITAEKTRVFIVAAGADTEGKQEGATFHFFWNPPPAGRALQMSMRIEWRGGKVDGISRETFVASDARVQLPSELPISPVEGGCAKDAHCVPLDLGKSTGLWPGLKLVMTRKKPTSGEGWPEAAMHLKIGDKLMPLERDKPLDLSYEPTQTWQICYAAPRCKAPPATTAEALEIKPVHYCLDDFDEACKKTPGAVGCDKGRTATILVKADVHPNTWLDCNLWWILIVAGIVLLIIIIVGIVTPNQFASAAMVRVANNDRQLRREQGRPLRREPGGKRGFYRTATVCFTDIGTTVKKSQGHILMLKAGPDKEIQIHRKGATLERFERNSWRTVDPTANGKDILTERTLVSGGLYRVNNTYFFTVDF